MFNFKGKTDKELIGIETPQVNSIKELEELLKACKEISGYGECVYAISLFTTAAFNFISGEVGATGFQAGCADLDVVRRTRKMNVGFMIIDYKKLLYPQYKTEKHFPSYNKLLVDNITELKKEAEKLLQEKGEFASEKVVEHWKKITNIKDVVVK